MTDTEAKALALVNAHAINRRSVVDDAKHTELRCALLDAVQAQAAAEARHAADKERYEKRTAMLLERDRRRAAELREQAERFEAFRQEVSDAVEKLLEWPSVRAQSLIVASLSPFILPEPDPLVEVISEVRVSHQLRSDQEMADELHAALAARGYEIRKIGEAGE